MRQGAQAEQPQQTAATLFLLQPRPQPSMNRECESLCPLPAANPMRWTGDLLFITEGLSGVSAPQIRVSHVVVWTGLAADVATNGTALSLETLISNMTPRQRAGARAYAAKRAAAGLPVYVINDSTWTGPNYRPFAGGLVPDLAACGGVRACACVRGWVRTSVLHVER